MADYAKQIAKKSGLKITVFEESQLKKMKMGCLLGVGQGSKSTPKLVVIEYNGSKGKPLALVGKGVCFDTGGYNLKPYPYILHYVRIWF